MYTSRAPCEAKGGGFSKSLLVRLADNAGTVRATVGRSAPPHRWEQPLRLALEPPPLVSELVTLGLQLLEVQGEWQVGGWLGGWVGGWR